MSAPAPLGLVVNPSATRTDRALIRLVQEALAHHGLVSVATPTQPGATRAAIEDAVAAGAATVAVLGGDGTIGLAAAVLAGGPVALLPLPGGSTNVFARGLGWPASPREAAAGIGAAMTAPGREVALGLADADGHTTVVCVNAGVGVDAAAVDWVERHPRVKHALRQAAFAGAALGPGWREMRRTGPMLLDTGHGAPLMVYGLVAAWGRPYAYLGPRPLDVLPNACWDGRMEWLAITSPSALRIAGVVAGGLRGGGAALTAAHTAGGLTSGAITLTARTPVAAQADGDPLGRVSRLVLSPGPLLRVRTPQAFAGSGR